MTQLVLWIQIDLGCLGLLLWGGWGGSPFSHQADENNVFMVVTELTEIM